MSAGRSFTPLTFLDDSSAILAAFSSSVMAATRFLAYMRRRSRASAGSSIDGMHATSIKVWSAPSVSHLRLLSHPTGPSGRKSKVVTPTQAT